MASGPYDPDVPVFIPDAGMQQVVPITGVVVDRTALAVALNYLNHIVASFGGRVDEQLSLAVSQLNDDFAGGT